MRLDLGNGETLELEDSDRGLYKITLDSDITNEFCQVTLTLEELQQLQFIIHQKINTALLVNIARQQK